MVTHLQQLLSSVARQASWPAKLPKHRLCGARLSEEETTSVEDFLAKQRVDLCVQPIKKSAGLVADIKVLMENHEQWICETLGLDVRIKRPDMAKIHIFQENKFRTLAKQLGKPDSWAGTQYEPSGEIVLLDKPSRCATLSNLGHELMHSYETTTHFVQRIANGIRVTPHIYGFQGPPQNNSFRLINEVVTESANIEALDYLRMRGGPDWLSGAHTGYASGIISLDIMLQEIAEARGSDVRDVRREIYIGCFKGQPSVLRMLEAGRNKGTLKFLKNLPHNAAFAQPETGLLLRHKVSAYDRGEPVEILGKIKIKKPQAA